MNSYAIVSVLHFLEDLDLILILTLNFWRYVCRSFITLSVSQSVSGFAMVVPVVVSSQGGHGVVVAQDGIVQTGVDCVVGAVVSF